MHYYLVLTDFNEYCTVLFNGKLHIVWKALAQHQDINANLCFSHIVKSALKKGHGYPQITCNIISKPHLPKPNLFNPQMGIQSHLS